MLGKMSDAASVGIVGARKAQTVALHRSYMLGRLVARSGLVTVSGGAIGVDIHALDGAYEAGGLTMTVLGSGLSHPSPRCHIERFARYSARGAIISPYSCDFRATRWSFVKKRWIAELSKCLLSSKPALERHMHRSARIDPSPGVLIRTHRNHLHKDVEQDL